MNEARCYHGCLVGECIICMNNNSLASRTNQPAPRPDESAQPQRKPNGKTFRCADGKTYCDECCNGDRCDDPTHRDRRNCPYCLGEGVIPEPAQPAPTEQDVAKLVELVKARTAFTDLSLVQFDAAYPAYRKFGPNEILDHIDAAIVREVLALSYFSQFRRKP